MNDTNAFFFATLEGLAYESAKFEYPKPTHQTVGGPYAIKKVYSALDKCVARGLEDLAQKYANALINSDLAGPALVNLVTTTIEEVALTPGNINLCAALVMLTLSQGEAVVGGPSRALQLAIHLILKGPVFRSYSNKNIRRSVFCDWKISDEAWRYRKTVHQIQLATDYLKLSHPVWHLPSEAAYKELVFGGNLMRMLQGWTEPNSIIPAGEPSMSWFVDYMKMSPAEAFLHSHGKRLVYPLAGLQDYGGQVKAIMYHKEYPTEPATGYMQPYTNPSLHIKGQKEGKGNVWKLIGGVPEFAFDSSTKEGVLAAQTILELEVVKKLFKQHPQCSYPNQQHVIHYFIDMMEQGECSYYLQSLDSARFIQEQHYRLLGIYWGIASHINPEYVQDVRNSINLFSEQLQALLVHHLFAHRSLAVANF